MEHFPRPGTTTLSVEREPVTGQCTECGAAALQRYPVVSEGGWWSAVKCAQCLHSVDRARLGMFGSMTALTLELAANEGVAS